MKRKCVVCEAADKEFLVDIRFISPGNSKVLSYDIVSCRKCGFLFADNIPSPQAMKKYYESSSKYSYNQNIPRGLQKIHQNLYSMINSTLQERFEELERKEIRVLDVGCGCGHLLHYFAESGYAQAIGIEPSKACCVLAKKMYGLSVRQGSINEFKPRMKFHVIMLTGVLEHVLQLKEMLLSIFRLLEDKGLVFLAVPDAQHFSRNPKAPFDEFSLEHVNFFTRTSLANIAANSGFAPLQTDFFAADFYDSNSLMTAFEKKRSKFRKDMAGKRNLKSYIDASQRTLAGFEKRFKPVIDSGSEIIVWGTGSLTSRLLASTSLGKARITAFIDSSRDLWGKRLNGVPIRPPDFIKETGCKTVLIGSSIYMQEITKVLRENYGYSGTILTLR